MKRFVRVASLTFIAFAVSTIVAAGITSAVSAATGCTLNWYGYDCPRWLWPVSIYGLFLLIPGILLGLAGILMRRRR